MELEQKLRLQEKAKEGRDVYEVRLLYFGDVFLEEIKDRTLQELIAAESYEELVTVRERYRAVQDFIYRLASIERTGNRAAKTIKGEIQHENTISL